MKSTFRSTWLTPLLALALALAFGARQETPEPAASEPSGEPERVLVAASEIWEHPASHLGQILSIEVQMHSEAPSWNPMLTRFGPGDFRSFRAWADEQFPWVEGDYRRPLVRVFARRGSAAEWALENAPIYARFELLCRVTSNFAGTPWVEVLAVKPRPRHLDDGVVIHATRGIEYMAKELWMAAIVQFERATSDGIPPKARRELGRLIDICTTRGAKAGNIDILRRIRSEE